MSVIIESLIINCKVASYFFIILMILRPITGRYFNETWQYILMRINLILFFVPISIFSDMAATLIEKMSPEISVKTTEFSQFIINETNLNVEQTTQNMNSVTNLDIINISWIMGGIFAIIWQCYCRVKLCRELNKSNDIIDDIKEFDIYKKELKISKKIDIIENNNIYSPVLIGLLKPKILLPMNKIKCEHLENIFKHELIHYKRKDLWWKAMLNILYIIYWWNPLIYIFGNMFDIVLEYSCDEVVIRNKTQKERKSYGIAILESIDETQKLTPMLSVSLRTPKQKLENRLKSMMKYNRMKIATKIISLSLTLVLLMGISLPSIVSALNESSLNISSIESNTVVEEDVKENLVEEDVNENLVEEDVILKNKIEELKKEKVSIEAPVTMIKPRDNLYFTIIEIPQETEDKFTKDEWEEIMSKTLTGELILVPPTNESQILVKFIELGDELDIITEEVYALEKSSYKNENTINIDNTTQFEFSYGIVSVVPPI